MVRLKSGLWVSAFLRQRSVLGQFGAVLRRGADEAGAVYIVINHLDGTCHLFGPAPGAAYDDDGARRWQIEAEPPADMTAIDAIMSRHKKFDPDIWLVEIEDRTGTAGLAPVRGEA